MVSHLVACGGVLAGALGHDVWGLPIDGCRAGRAIAAQSR